MRVGRNRRDTTHLGHRRPTPNGNSQPLSPSHGQYSQSPDLLSSNQHGVSLKLWELHATARGHRNSRRRSGITAACRSRATADEAADHRIPGPAHVIRHEPMDRRFCAATARARLDGGPQHCDRVPMGRGTRRALRRARGRVCTAESSMSSSQAVPQQLSRQSRRQ